jgi:uncharacterized RDD family membrane protein YckC
MSVTRVPYAGLATRALALALDVAIINVIVFACAAVLGLVGSLVGDVQLDTLGRLLAAAAWGLAVASYFVLFWSAVGQTPAMRLMDIRVRMAGSTDPPSLWRSCVRLIGLGLAIIPFFAGFLPVLVDDRRRGIHDMLAGTIVEHSDGGGPLFSAPVP